MKKIYIKGNYIIADNDGVFSEYPTSRCAYTKTPTSIFIKEQIDTGTLVIPLTEIGLWYDEAGVVAFTESTLTEFLQNNTANFNKVTGGNVTDGLIVGQIPRWDGVKYEPSNDVNLGENDLVSNNNIRSFKLNGLTTGNQLKFTDIINRPVLQMNGAGQVWSYGKGFQTANTGFGDGAFNAMSSGNGNSAFGTLSSPNLSSGFDNVSMGRASMFGLVNGNRNTGIGYFALARNVSGSNNTALGTDAGNRAVSGAYLSSAVNCVLIGHDARPLANGAVNEIVIAKSGQGNGNNTTTIGNGSTIATYLKGKLNVSAIPTSSLGLSVGDIWSNLGILTII